jgi:hypothetical protein
MLKWYKELWITRCHDRGLFSITNCEWHLRQQYSLDLHLPVFQLHSDGRNHVQGNRHYAKPWLCAQPNSTIPENRPCS